MILEWKILMSSAYPKKKKKQWLVLHNPSPLETKHCCNSVAIPQLSSWLIPTQWINIFNTFVWRVMFSEGSAQVEMELKRYSCTHEKRLLVDYQKATNCTSIFHAWEKEYEPVVELLKDIKLHKNYVTTVCHEIISLLREICGRDFETIDGLKAAFVCSVFNYYWMIIHSGHTRIRCSSPHVINSLVKGFYLDFIQLYLCYKYY